MTKLINNIFETIIHTNNLKGNFLLEGGGRNFVNSQAKVKPLFQNLKIAIIDKRKFSKLILSNSATRFEWNRLNFLYFVFCFILESTNISRYVCKNC